MKSAHNAPEEQRNQGPLLAEGQVKHRQEPAEPTQVQRKTFLQAPRAVQYLVELSEGKKAQNDPSPPPLKSLARGFRCGLSNPKNNGSVDRKNEPSAPPPTGAKGYYMMRFHGSKVVKFCSKSSICTAFCPAAKWPAALNSLGNSAPHWVPSKCHFCVPVCPKPPAPRSDSGSTSTGVHCTWAYAARTSCAMRSPGSMTKGSPPKLMRITPTSPR